MVTPSDVGPPHLWSHEGSTRTEGSEAGSVASEMVKRGETLMVRGGGHSCGHVAAGFAPGACLSGKDVRRCVLVARDGSGDPAPVTHLGSEVEQPTRSADRGG
ncbi:hypothetical protein GCM10009858_09370 [Terrabacter carboxydivorans]|uniref:Uncharacterized protein n=1 Tax=Terrabacter carboxydivorans TaxID=619730 RepID=A0ABP5Y2U8_9MICO